MIAIIVIVVLGVYGICSSQAEEKNGGVQLQQLKLGSNHFSLSKW